MTKRSPLLTASALAFALAGAAGAGAARADELVVPKATPAAAEPEAPAPQAPANWLVYNGNQSSVSFGRPSAAGPPRQIQIGVRFDF